MRKHWRYLSYVCRHKWFVFVACMRLGVPLHRAIFHDWTKFLLSEWLPYAEYFYGDKETPSPGKYGYCHTAGSDAAFDAAWNHHQKRNKHHWQYWLLVNDDNDGGYIPLPMPDAYMREMVADWVGAGKAQGKPDTAAWYEENKAKMVLHPRTRLKVELLLEGL